jgi:hypothetical protein
LHDAERNLQITHVYVLLTTMNHHHQAEHIIATIASDHGPTCHGVVGKVQGLQVCEPRKAIRQTAGHVGAAHAQFLQ